ncbi:hypothetical protein RCJ22_36855, partial [Vibrio sp. FNV 38]|nr:hypothetical protein [Vibrio sp. FNV 38]
RVPTSSAKRKGAETTIQDERRKESPDRFGRRNVQLQQSDGQKPEQPHRSGNRKHSDKQLDWRFAQYEETEKRGA